MARATVLFTLTTVTTENPSIKNLKSPGRQHKDIKHRRKAHIGS